MNEDYVIKCIIKSMFEDKDYAITVCSVFISEYFDDPVVSEVYNAIKKYSMEYDSVPSKEIVLNSIPSDIKDDADALFKEIDSFEFSVSKNYDWLMEETNKYLKDRAIKKAILDGIDIIDSGKNINEIRAIIEDALCKDLKADIGLDYFNQLGERLKKIFESSENRVKLYYPCFDELFCGGYPPYSLNVFIARVHGHKSNIMSNIISRQVMNGVNVAIATLEMSELMYAQRFDANFTNLDINRIYVNREIKKKFFKKIKNIKGCTSRGNLYIKEYPTGKATVNDYRIWLRELKMRGIVPNIFYCDYISLMKPEGKSSGDLYRDGKSISEELRALGMEFDIPVVTVAQINRAGTFMDFHTLDMNSIGESWGIPATADSMIVQGIDEDDMIYKNEFKWKCVKNRLGGRVGTIGKLYWDAKSLRIYDESELDKWIEDSKESGDDREVITNDD